jgi:hypothetical protein
MFVIKIAYFMLNFLNLKSFQSTEVGRAPLIIFNFAIYWLGLSIWILLDT